MQGYLIYTIMTYKELVYMALDALKIHSDDSKFTEDHVIFLLNKYRAYALYQKYSKTLEGINNRNYQSINIECKTDIVKFLQDISGGMILKSNREIPSIINISLPEVQIETTVTEGEGENATTYKGNESIVFTTEDRIRYTGFNRFLKKVIYCCIDKNNIFILKCADKTKIQDIKEVQLYAIFSDPVSVFNFNGSTLDVLEEQFPLEDALVPGVLELVLKDLTNGIYKPSDNLNDAQDALSDLAGYLRRNMKSQFQKQIDD